MKLRSLTIGLSLLATGTVIGIATQQFASADISSGDRIVLIPIETCRIADTRPAPDTVGPKASPLAAADTMRVDAQKPGTDCTGNIPTDATALSLNVTALNASSNSFLTIWPGGPRPIASALNPAPGVRVFNAVTTELSPTQTFDVFNNRGSVDVFVDVIGYYEHHDHDDRYPTDAEVEAAIGAASPSVVVSEGVNVSPNYSFTPEVTFSSASETITTDRAGYLQVSKYFSGNASCTPSNTGERAYYITVDGVGLASSALFAFDASNQLVRLAGVTNTVIPAGDHEISVAAECYATFTAGGATLRVISNASVVVLPA